MLVSVAKCRTEQSFYLAVIPAPAQDHAYPEFVLPEQARWPSVRHGCPLYLGQRCILGWCVCVCRPLQYCSTDICTGQCWQAVSTLHYGSTLHYRPAQASVRKQYCRTVLASTEQCTQSMKCRRPEQPLTTNSSSWSCIAYRTSSNNMESVHFLSLIFFIWHFQCFYFGCYILLSNVIMLHMGEGSCFHSLRMGWAVDRALITKMRDMGMRGAGRGKAYCKSCNVLFKEPGVWVYRGMVLFGGAVIGADQWSWWGAVAHSGHKWSGEWCAPRGCVHRSCCPALSAQVCTNVATSSQVQQVSRFSKLAPPTS